MRLVLALALCLLLAVPASASRILQVDVDPSIPEETDLSEFVLEVYDLGGDQVGLRIYRLSRLWGVAHQSHAEIRMRRDQLGAPITVAAGATVYLDGFMTAMMKAEMVDHVKPSGTLWELPGTNPERTDCLMEYLLELGTIEQANGPIWFNVQPTGTKILYGNLDDLTSVQLRQWDDFADSVNTLVPGLSNNVVIVPYTGASPNVTGLPFPQKEHFVDNEVLYNQAVNAFDDQRQEIKIFGVGAAIAVVIEEGFHMLQNKGINSWSARTETYAPIDIYAYRTEWMSPVGNAMYPGSDVYIDVNKFVAPNFNDIGSGFPREIDPSLLIAVAPLDSNGYVEIDLEQATSAPPARTPALHQNTPNPFNPTTTIAYTTSLEGHVSLKIYDVAGRYIATLVDESMPAGEYTAMWDGTDASGVPVSSGTYLYELTTGDYRETRKMVLVR